MRLHCPLLGTSLYIDTYKHSFFYVMFINLGIALLYEADIHPDSPPKSDIIPSDLGDL